jgi:hypothetical protein
MTLVVNSPLNEEGDILIITARGQLKINIINNPSNYIVLIYCSDSLSVDPLSTGNKLVYRALHISQD